MIMNEFLMETFINQLREGKTFRLIRCDRAKDIYTKCSCTSVDSHGVGWLVNDASGKSKDIENHHKINVDVGGSQYLMKYFHVILGEENPFHSHSKFMEIKFWKEFSYYSIWFVGKNSDLKVLCVVLNWGEPNKFVFSYAKRKKGM